MLSTTFLDFCTSTLLSIPYLKVSYKPWTPSYNFFDSESHSSFNSFSSSEISSNSSFETCFFGILFFMKERIWESLLESVEKVWSFTNTIFLFFFYFSRSSGVMFSSLNLSNFAYSFLNSNFYLTSSSGGKASYQYSFILLNIFFLLNYLDNSLWILLIIYWN